MITPVIIQILFWILIIIAVLVGIGMIIGGIAAGQGMVAVLGLVYLVLGPIAVRVYCELLIIFFRMNDTLTDIHDVLKSR